MAFYRVCSSCGAALDSGERCDCQDKRETAPVRQHQGGKVDQKLTDHRSTLMIPSNEQKIKGECITNGQCD